MCSHYNFDLTKEHRHYVKCEYNNCLLCLVAAKGPMKRTEIAKYLNLSSARVTQIEKNAIQKMGNLIKNLEKNTLH